VSQVLRLPRRAFPKVWGAPQTEPWFTNPNHEKIGEVWFESPPATPLLVKFLFTSESLSIQVHPDDAYARAHHNSFGKTEMWHILHADPGAKIAVGPRREITAQDLAQAAGKKGILDLLQWVEVHPGDTWFIPAGTIHALGGGLALCEIQQLSDVTYRLYDYGRDRELHIEHSLNVSRLTPCEGKRDPVALEPGRELLAECEYFRAERLTVSGAALCEPRHICVVLEGEGRIGQETFGPGDAFAIGEEAMRIEGSRAIFVSVTSQCEPPVTRK
jgi:mannose-6-phosphate isomerase